uniref:Uncharacterized protein n=1 Tax=Romanomermis culicivorax TaxID=13658 RepID=A0A915KUA9_ROMCU
MPRMASAIVESEDKYNIKGMIRITEFERWFETVYAWPLNVLGEPTYVESGDLKKALAMYTKPNFRRSGLTSKKFRRINYISTRKPSWISRIKMRLTSQDSSSLGS